MKKSTKLLYGFIFLALIIFAFTDLSISQALFNPNSGFGHFLENFGEIPMTAVGCFSASALMLTTKKDGSIKSKATIGGFALLLVWNALTAALMFKKNLDLPMITVILLFFAHMIGFYFLAKLVPEKNHPALRKAAIIGIILSFLAVFVITIIKMLWGRQRYRSMIDPLAEFSPWYLPQQMTLNNEKMSFPSGHSANSSVIIWISLLPMFIDRLRGQEKLLTAIATAWFLLVMLSRVIMGAHFASDVTMGMTISITIFFLLKKHFIKIE